jgi:surfeit locus 1 family protein
MKPRIWPILLASAIGLAILLALGVWQVQRLAWKNALIADLERRAQEPAIELTSDLFAFTNGQGSKTLAEHTRVKAHGEFLPAPPFRFIAVANGAPGWRLLHLFRTDTDLYLFVDRGVLPDGATIKMPSGKIEIHGIVAQHNQGAGLFDPENDFANNQWYWWDWYMLQHFAGETLDRGILTDFAVQLLPDTPGTEGLIVEPPKTNLRNNHLGYAITWFGLAAALMVMTGVFVMRIRRAP